VSGTWEKASASMPADRHATLRLFLKDDSGGQAAVLLGAGAMSDAAKEVSGSFRLDPGFVVRPGQTICAVLDTAGGNVAVNVIAYRCLTKDK
jgi:hypothetical protein